MCSVPSLLQCWQNHDQRVKTICYLSALSTTAVIELLWWNKLWWLSSGNCHNCCDICALTYQCEIDHETIKSQPQIWYATCIESDSSSSTEQTVSSELFSDSSDSEYSDSSSTDSEMSAASNEYAGLPELYQWISIIYFKLGTIWSQLVACAVD